MTMSALVAYYVGAYGPTVRIDVQLQAELEALHALFVRLASTSGREEDFGR
jgi:hypothetical protein